MVAIRNREVRTKVVRILGGQINYNAILSLIQNLQCPEEQFGYSMVKSLFQISCQKSIPALTKIPEEANLAVKIQTRPVLDKI